MKCALVSYWKDIDVILGELKQYDKVFACEQAAYDLAKSGVSLEKVISDFDSVQKEKLEQLNLDVEILPSRKNETDTTALFHYIEDSYPQSEITLYNEFTDRIDHALVLFSLFGQKKMSIRTPYSEISYVIPGKYVLNQKSDYKYISFIALETIINIELINFQYPLKKQELVAFSDLTVSNEFIDNESGILKFSEGKILIIYSKDNRN